MKVLTDDYGLKYRLGYTKKVEVLFPDGKIWIEFNINEVPKNIFRELLLINLAV